MIDMAPVRDCEGHIVRRVRVPRGELTCVQCGETTTENYCTRCSLDEDGRRKRGAGTLIPTMDYLSEDDVLFTN